MLCPRELAGWLRRADRASKNWEARVDIPGGIGGLRRPSLAKFHDVVEVYKNEDSLLFALQKAFESGMVTSRECELLMSTPEAQEYVEKLWDARNNASVKKTFKSELDAVDNDPDW